MKRPDESTPGDECALCIIGAPPAECGRIRGRDGDCVLGLMGSCIVVGVVNIGETAAGELLPLLGIVGRLVVGLGETFCPMGGDGGSCISLGESCDEESLTDRPVDSSGIAALR